MKTLKHLCTLVLLLCSVAANAFTVDNITYNITDSVNKTVEVKEAYIYGDLVIPNTVVSDGITYTVTGIKKEITGRDRLSSIFIPKSVSNIESIFFYKANQERRHSLTKIVVEEGNPYYDSRDSCNAIIETATNTLLYGCNGTKIPESVTSIGNDAFRTCYELTEITIPDAVTSIGSSAFHDCESLTDVTIGNGVSIIEDFAFYRCKALTSVKIGNGINHIDDSAFRSCTKLMTFTIDAINAPTLGDRVFYEIPSRYHVVLNIPDNTHANYLKWARYFKMSDVEYGTGSDGDVECYLNIKDSIGYIYGTGEVSELNLNGDRDIKYLYIEGEITSVNLKNSFHNIEYIYLPESLTSIGNSAFEYHYKLKEINFPSSLTTIGDYAFYECQSLRNIFLPTSLVSIGDYAFSNVPIEFIVIPQFVTSIGNYAFTDSYDYELEKGVNPTIVFKSFVAPSLGEYGYINLVIPEGANSYPTGQYGQVQEYSSQKEYCFASSNEKSHMFVFGNTDDGSEINLNDINSVTFAPNATGYNLISRMSNLTSVNVLKCALKDGFLYTIDGSNAIFKYKEDQPEDTILVAGCAHTIIPQGTTVIDDNAFNGCTGLKDILFSNSIHSIGFQAFDGCTGLTNLSIPNNVTSLDYDAFNNCTGLKSVKIYSEYSPNFSGCSNLSDLYLGEKCREINNILGFQGCSALTNIFVGESNTKYDSRDSCNAVIETATNSLVLGGLGTVIPESVTTIGSSAFKAWHGDMNVPASVKKIEKGAFREAARTNFESETPPTITGDVFGWGAVFVPTSAYDTYCNAPVWSDYKDRIVTVELANKDIEVASTEGMSGVLDAVGLDNADKVVKLKVRGEINSYDIIVIRDKMPLLNELDLSEASVVSSTKPYYDNIYCTGYNALPGYAFYDLDKLLNVKLPKNLTTIGDKAFYGCDRITHIDASATGILNIGAESFYNCKKLTEFVSPAKISEIGQQAFYGCSNLKGIELRYISGSIGAYAFRECNLLTDIQIDYLGGNLEDKAFGYCRFLKNITFEKGPAKMGSRVFEYSDSLENFVAGEGLTEVPNEAFVAYDIVMGPYGPKEIEIDRIALKKVILPKSVNAIGIKAFNRCISLKHFEMPQGITSIGESAFYSCSSLDSINIPSGITTIPKAAFENCSSLRNVKFSDALTNVGDYAFSGCRLLKDIKFSAAMTNIGNGAFQNCGFKTLTLPPYLKTIGVSAFNGNVSLEELHIPSAVENINDNAFGNCRNLNSIYTYTVEPTVISENTFSSFATANLYVPSTSFWNYYWDNGWSRFNHKKFVEFNKPYDYFYLNHDYYLNGGTGFIDGNPDADMRPGSGLIVDSDENGGEQNLGNVNLSSDGEGNSATIIGDQNLHIDNLYIKINVKGGRWYFFAFPWDVPLEKISTQDGNDYVFRYYDGEERAKKGKGGWKNVNDNYLKAARGYIFQSSADDVLLLSIEDVRFKKIDKFNELITHTSENLKDASWNMMGNPYLSYYDMSAMDYTSPVTVWDGEKYVAIRPGDDNYQFAPYEAFFVQKPEGKSHVGFVGERQMTKIQSDTLMVQQKVMRRNRLLNPQRLLINLVVEGDSLQDVTRVVFNNMQKLCYETACDAAKFETKGILQLYSHDMNGVRYAINERPVDDGVVFIGYTAPQAGEYSINVTRMDTKVILYDAETGSEHDFEKGSYVFSSDKGTFENRFSLGMPDNKETGIKDINIDDFVEVVDEGLSINGDVVATIYNSGGVLVVTQNGAGIVKLQPGIYVVYIGSNSKKVLVK